MKIAVTGATGFVGTHLVKNLKQGGHTVVQLGRPDLSQAAANKLASKLSDCEAVINLAGEPINRRWTNSYKAQMISSRVATTERLVQTMGELDSPPGLFVSTSAIGAFASHGCYTEADAPNGTDFLGRLARDWERAADEARSTGIRTLVFRFGLVLGSDGGLIAQLLPPFRSGLGGPVGDGSQYFSWIHIADLVAVYLHALEDQSMDGVYHLCAPQPVTNREFTRLLGKVLNRPARLKVPLFMLKMMYGEGGEAMASGQCVRSDRLPECGFQFQYPELETALKEIVQGN